MLCGAIAAERSIRVVGDVAIFVNHDSADVWTHRELFRLDDNLEPEVVAGVPPDFFSKTGQRWGNPLYRWDVMKQRGYQMVDPAPALGNAELRLHPPRSFPWLRSVLGDSCRATTTAVNGRWVDGPRDDLFAKLREALGWACRSSPKISATSLLKCMRCASGCRFPAWRCCSSASETKARTCICRIAPSGKVIYTGTHDNDTVAGWWNSGASEDERRNAEAYVGRCDDGIHWAFIRAAQSSPASLSIIPLQDVLGLGSEARMNTPSLQWRQLALALLNQSQLKHRSRRKTGPPRRMSDRLPKPFRSDRRLD